MEDQIYSFVLRGNLAKVAMERTELLGRSNNSNYIDSEIAEHLSIDLLDEEHVIISKKMASVYVAITSFENMVRDFIAKTLSEEKGENWWEESVSEAIRKRAESRRKEEEKIKWHQQRGDRLLNYTEMGDLNNIIQQNWNEFEDYLISLDWARQIINTLERSRNVIMHGGELGDRDIERVGTNIRDWINQVG
ncbi:MAG: Swt1 family HEPN domain-containing protein [Clostridia bacterium]